MKNFAGLFFILLVMQGVQGMDLAKREKSYNPTDEQCMRVAFYLSLAKNKEKRDIFESCDENSVRNPLAIKKTKQLLQDTDNAMAFLKSIPKIKGCELDSQTKALSEDVRFIAGELSRSNMFVFVTYKRDFFTAMYKASLPEKYEDRSGFFSEKSNSEVQVVSSENRPVYPVLSQAEMIKKLQEFPLDKALYALTFVDIPLSQPSEARFERVEKDDSCIKVVPTQYVPARVYQWTLEDCEKFTSEQRALFDKILTCSNEYKHWQNVDRRFLVTEKETDVLLSRDHYSAKEFILNNKKYGEAQIKVDIAPSTTWESFFNKMLYWFPHAIVMIIPDLVQSQIDGVCNSAAGIVMCAAGSFGFGECIYPEIDSYNYNVHKLSQWFGRNNHRKKRAGLDFVFISVVSSLANLAGQKLLSWQALPWKILGGGIHAMRVLVSGMALVNKEKIANKDPFTRNNASGTAFILEDLANGPKLTR